MNFAQTGNDTLTLWDRVFSNLADGDAVAINYTNDLVAGKTGKNQNTILAKNEQGNNADVIIRVLRGSDDDKFLMKKQALIEKDFAAFELANGSFVKRMGDGSGNVTRDVYTLLGGVMKKKVDARDNVEGSTDQAVSVYTMFFANVKREAQ